MKVSDLVMEHEFVEFIPEQIAPAKLYVSIPYATAAHKCFCGCGEEVVTPLSPTDWRLIYDGQSISLEPSIGNWSFACKSHYLIINGRIHWAEEWTQELIERGRDRDRSRKAKFYREQPYKRLGTKTSKEEDANSNTPKGWIGKILNWLN